MRRTDGWRIRTFLEVAFITLLFCLGSHFFHGNDPCFVRTPLPVPVLLLAVVTLFYGYAGGLPALAMLGVAMKLHYREFPLELFLMEAVLTFVFAEFRAYWGKNIEINASKERYLKTKFEELSAAFYTLKISHDQLEKNYVVKPMSLRTAIGEIRKNYRDDAKSYASFLRLLKESFSVTEAIVVWRKEDGFVKSAGPEGIEFDLNDPLVAEAMDRKEPVYIAKKTEVTSRYIAVLPAVIEQQVVGMLCIKEMPFMAYNKDNLLTLAILLESFGYEISRSRYLKETKEIFGFGSDDLRYELKRLANIEKRYGLASSLVLMTCGDELSRVATLQAIEKSLRALDSCEMLETPRGYVIALLFPLSAKSVVEGYMQRLETLLAQKGVELCPYIHFSMRQIPLARQYLQKASDE